MSTEVTPESPDLLRRVANAWTGDTASDDSTRRQLRARADQLEHQQRPLPTKPGWYPNIVVERGGESCTGAMLTSQGIWATGDGLDGRNAHSPEDVAITIRWAEQDGKTPGQTLWEAPTIHGTNPGWSLAKPALRERWEQRAAAVLAAHGTPTLTPVGEHPKPGTRGLLPVVQESGEWCSRELGMFLCLAGSTASRAILVDPRPGGAHE